MKDKNSLKYDLIKVYSDKNKDLKKLKEAGYYSQILERFVSTTFVLFFSIIIFLFLVFVNNFEIGYYFLYVINLLVIALLLLILLRIYRSLKILNMIYKIIYKKNVD